MKRTRLVTAIAALFMVVGFAAAAQDATTQTTPPVYGPGWRQTQMIQARQNGQLPPAMIAPRGPGMAYGPGYGMGRRAATNADGTLDTSRLPNWCPYRTAAPQTK